MEFALALPGAWEDHPWGESAAKVGVKVFAFFGVPGTGFGMTVKLPNSAEALLTMPFARPAGYNLGKSGWVEMHFTDDDPPPVDLLLDCVEESYRALAPKDPRPRAGRPRGVGASKPVLPPPPARPNVAVRPTVAPAVDRPPPPGQCRRRC